MRLQQAMEPPVILRVNQKWKNYIFGCMVILVACNIAPTLYIKPRIIETYTTQDSRILIQNGYTNYLPIISSTYDEHSCSQSSFGTMLIKADPNDWITPAQIMIQANDQFGVKGMVAAGAPSGEVRDHWFGKLAGWIRSFIRGTYDQLILIHSTATSFGMQDMYECIAYGPESAHQAGDEALEPLTWVPMAEALAESTGKCLIYGPAVLDYELMATPIGANQPDEAILAELIADVASHVDVWMIQLAKYQRWADAGYDDNGEIFSSRISSIGLLGGLHR